MKEQHSTGFDEFFQVHFDAVYSYVVFRLAPDQEAARDISQTVFEAAVQKWKTVQELPSAKAWLMQVARNKVADHFRGHYSHVQLHPITAALEVADPDSTAEAHERRERAMLASRVLRQLPNEQVDLLEDKYISGLSVSEMADARRVTQKAVESALARAREAFKRAFSHIQSTQESAP